MASMDSSRHDQFLRLFTTSEPALRAFVRSLVPTVTDADDVLQEVAITLWQKFGEFSETGEEDFRRWAFGVAKFKVLSWRRDRGRDRHVFGDATMEMLARDSEAQSDKLQAQRDALKICLGKLPEQQRQLMDSAYAPGTKIDALAETAGRTAMALYKQLHRIRMRLVECTRAVLAKEGWS